MLYNDVNHFNWSVVNYTDYPGATGTQLTADGSSHTKGSDTALLAGIAEDCYGIHIVVSSGTTDATVRRQLTDLRIDPAAGVGNAGSSWSTFIDNIYTGEPATGTSGAQGHHFYFPVFLKAGTAIGARVQDVVGGATCRYSIKVIGKPTRPDLVRVGTKVQTIGADTANTAGVSFVPGTSAAVGSYSASLGTTNLRSWWWQLGVGSGDTTMNTAHYRFDVAHDATNKYFCIQGINYYIPTTTGEICSKSAFGDGLPIMVAPAGQDVYVRGSCITGVPDGAFTAVVYAVS